MQPFLRALDEKVSWLLNVLAFVSSLLVMGLMLFLILARYVFGWSLVGILEMVMLSGMWLYMSGALIASRRREHLVVDFLELQLTNPRLQAMHRMLVAMIVVIISACFVYWAQRMLAWGVQRPQHTPELSIPLWYAQAAIMFASIGCFCYALRDLWLSVVEFRGLRAEHPLAREAN